MGNNERILSKRIGDFNMFMKPYTNTSDKSNERYFKNCIGVWFSCKKVGNNWVLFHKGEELGSVCFSPLVSCQKIYEDIVL